jgi:hypothetical protein
MRVFKRFLCALALVAAAVPGAVPVSARAASFDGLWSVLVITDKGDCDRGYRYALRVKDGRVHYDGEAGITVNGRVAANGRVTVSIGRGEQRASGTGRLSGNHGTGTWSGRSPTSACSGHWEAEKRGPAR